MPVNQVADSPSLQPNCVYVIPPDRELVIEGDDITARPFSEPRGRRAPIDMFFRSVAAVREDGIALVLSGAGSDGALGARAVKEAGGLVFVQDPHDAEYSMMPRSVIALGIADFVAPVAELAARVAEVMRSKQSVLTLSKEAADGEIRRIIGFLRSRTGHDFTQYKRATVNRRIARRMQVTRRATLADYADHLKSTPEEAQELFSDLLISVTMFFRDRKAFEVPATDVLPAIFDRLQNDEGIRAWVVGCATGEEAYSLAMLLLEEAGRRKLPPPLLIFATDLDEGALATAREGVYPRSIEADIADDRLHRFFVAEGEQYRVRKEVRELVLFATHSALKDPPFLRLDLITCRNFLIYLEREAQRQLCGLFHYALKPDGYLFLGSAETVDATAELFRPINRDARLYQAKAVASRRLPLLPQIAPEHRSAVRERPRPPRLAGELGTTGQHASALERLAPPSVLLDDAFKVLHLSPSAGRFLQPSEGPFRDELPSLIRPEVRVDLQASLHRAFEHGEASLTLPVIVAFDGTSRRIVLHIAPIASDQGLPAQALVFFLDGGPAEALDEAERRDHGERSEEVRRLYEELRVAQTRLGDLSADHDLAVQELRAANEELQSMNEEYRSTPEELETSKEELQSINEELRTVNAELKSKLESISSAHSDLRNLIASTDVGTLFLDPELRIKLFTPTVSELFNITDGDLGRTITHFTHNLDYDGLAADATTVLRELVPLEREVAVPDGRWLMVRMRPYRTIEDRIDGIVVSFVEVTDLRRSADRLRASEGRYRTLFESIDEGCLIVDVVRNPASQPIDWRVIDANPTAETMLKAAVKDRRLSQVVTGFEPLWWQLAGSVAETSEPQRHELFVQPLERWFELHLSRVPERAEGPHAAVLMQGHLGFGDWQRPVGCEGPRADRPRGARHDGRRLVRPDPPRGSRDG